MVGNQIGNYTQQSMSSMCVEFMQHDTATDTAPPLRIFIGPPGGAVYLVIKEISGR